jgi:hypothetical protein
MHRGLRTAAALAIAVVAIAVVAIAGGAPGADARSYYRKCGVVKFKGRHALFTHRYPCRKAKRKARYVLKHRRRPPHWKCTLAELPNGFAACHRKKRAWEFVPA